MCGAQSGKDVNMIVHPTDGMRDPTLGAHDAAKIFMQTRAQTRREPRLPVLGAEDEMVMQGEMGGGHARILPASLPGRILFFDAIR